MIERGFEKRQHYLFGAGGDGLALRFSLAERFRLAGQRGDCAVDRRERLVGPSLLA
jgi:hypothetical protein